MLSTAFALLIVSAICVGAAYVAYQAARSAVESGDRLERDLRAMRGLRDDVTALSSRLDRVSGRVYAQARRPKLAQEQADDDLFQLPLQNGQGDEIDPELAATIALQTAPPVAPGKRS